MSAILSRPQCVNVSFYSLQGSLLKKGHDVLTTWRDRWFVLSHRALKYYISSEERDLKGTIPLSPRLKVEVSITHPVRRDLRVPSQWVHSSRSRWVLHIQWGERPQGHHPTESTAQGQGKYYTSSEERDLKGTILLSPRLNVKVSITHPVRRETSRAPSYWVHGSRSR